MSRNPATDVLTHNALLILISCALLYFITLGAREVQPYAEAYDAMRARAVVEQGQWWDQSTLALGGSYTAAKPPLTVWAQSIFMKPMKMSPLSIRLFSALCGIASLFLIYAIACFMLPRKLALLAPALLCGTVVWNHFVRLGTSDIPFLCFCLLCLFALLHARREEDQFRRLLFVGLYGLSLAAAIETNLVASILPLLFIVLLWLESAALKLASEGPDAVLSAFATLSAESIRATSLRMPLIIASVAALCCSLPWYISMAMAHPGAFWSALLSPLPGADASMSWPGSPYHLNTLIIAQPMSLFALLWFVMWFREGRKVFLHSFDIALELLLGAWLGIAFVVISLVPLKQSASVLLVVPPAVLLSLRGLEVLMQTWSRKRAGLASLCFALVCVAWSAAQPLRAAVTDLFQFHFSLMSVVFILISLLLLLTALRVKSDQRLNWSVLLHRFFITVIPVVLVLRVAALNVWSVDECRRGAQKVGKWLHDSQATEFVVLMHPEQASDSLCSQLSWYTQGWAGYGRKSPWMPRYSSGYSRIHDLERDTVSQLWLESVNNPIVYVRPADDSLAAREERTLSHIHRIRLQTPAYTIFSRREYTNTMEGLDAELR